jgi:hypothetical protein
VRKPLPSWVDGGVGEAIVSFVRGVCNPASPRYVPPDDRIAVVDSDGTLWCEQPASALACFIMDRLAQPGLAPPWPVDVERDVLEAAAADDYAVFRALDARQLCQMLLLGSVGLSPEAFIDRVHAFLATAHHPRFGLPFGQVVYKPMLEVLTLLEAKQFRVFIAAGGGVEFVRAVSEPLFGVPRERVTGACADYAVQHVDGRIQVSRTGILLGDPGEGDAKVRAIVQSIGQRPIVAIGNSPGDQDMLDYVAAGSQPSLCLALRHDDPLREYAYGTLPTPGPHAARGNRWLTISMRDDFRRIFAPPARALARSMGWQARFPSQPA